MGQVVKVSCAKCGKSKKLFIGGGFSDCDFDVIIAVMSDIQKESLTKAIENGATDFSISRYASICQSCHNFYTAEKVTYLLGRKEKAEWSCCPDCGSVKKKLIDIETKTTKCTHCGDLIETELIGLWD